MKLLAREIRDTIYQEITVGRKPIHLVAARPHLYLQDWSTGSLSLGIELTDGTPVFSGSPQSMADITSATYYHVPGFDRP